MNCPFRHRLLLPLQQHNGHIHIHRRRHGGNDSAVCSDRGEHRDSTLRSTLHIYNLTSRCTQYSVCIYIHIPHTTHHTRTTHSTYSAYTYRVLDITPSRIFVIIDIMVSVYRFILGTGFGTIEFSPPFSLLLPTFTFGSFWWSGIEIRGSRMSF